VVISSLPWHAPFRRVAAILLAIAATGAAPRSADVLDTPVRASWTRLPLREWADRITGIVGVPVIVDRRIDHTTPITLDAAGEPVAAVLERGASLAGAAVEVLGSSIRLVPPEAAGRATAAEAARQAELRGLPAAERARLAARDAWAWAEGSEPRVMLERLVADAGVRLDGLQRVPHDHVPAETLPRLSVAERIDAVLAHFDLRAAWRPGGGEVVPAEERITPRPAGRSPPGPRPRVPPAEERHTLRLEAPLDQAIAALARRFSLRADIDTASLVACGIAPAEIVRVRVEGVSRDELLDAVVAPLGLLWAIDDGTLRVFAPPVLTPDATP
jgi:hypothetical protein